MTPISDTQEFARHFNEEEAIWRRFQEKRLARHLLEAGCPLPESVLDHLDWLEAATRDPDHPGGRKLLTRAKAVSPIRRAFPRAIRRS
jgi:hypothetical protein